MNKAIICGNLGRDPEIKVANSGTTICKLAVATAHRRKIGDDWEDQTEWHNVTVFGKQAESCGKFLSKGRQVLVEGRIETDTWEKDGVKKYRTGIIADNVKFIGGRDPQPRDTPSEERHDPGAYKPPSNDDLPF
jgi:single-strand DNA-binding protein|tara:strand:- start:1155 stop:1556 length:402 start_codon:yes stop_codon:yes gene_type:complete